MKRTGTMPAGRRLRRRRIALAACSERQRGLVRRSRASAGASTGAAKGTVRIAVNEWVGAEANVAVVKNLLRSMGYDGRDARSLAEEVAWQGFDATDPAARSTSILENWGHPDLEKLYFTDKKVAEDAGPNGVTGIIGWYVPQWMVDKYPDITDWNNLNKYASMFKTSESGDKGQFLASDPTFVTNDEALIIEPEARLQGGLQRQRGRERHGLPGSRQEQDPAHRLLLHAAVAERRSQARQDQLPGRTRTAAMPTRRRSPATTRRTRSTRPSGPSS